MQYPPGAFIVGAAKCGTTTLADLLASHPKIALAEPKEPDWFAVNHRQGADWYRACFRPLDADSILLDASTSYAAAPADGPPEGIPAFIHGLRPDARIVMLVRDPVQRAWSSYWHGVRAGDERRAPGPALRDAASVHIRAGLYWQRLQEFLAVFPRSQLLVVDMRDLQKDPLAVARCVAGFFGLDPGAVTLPDASATHRNTSYQWSGSGRAVQALLGSEGLVRVNQAVRRVLPQAVIRQVRRLLTRPVPEMPGDIAAALVNSFADDSARLKRDFDLETRTSPVWRRPGCAAA